MNLRVAVPGVKRQRGFSFFEVLVAALILGIGVLGFAGLQMRALGSTGVAHNRAQAAVLAAELTERIRIVEAGARSLPDTDPRRNNDSRLYLVQNWNPATTLPATPPGTWPLGSQSCIYVPTGGGSTLLSQTGCSETVLVTADALEMQYMANQLLPRGPNRRAGMSVRRCSAVSTLMCVYVGWSDQDANACVAGSTNANCFSMEVML